MSTCTSWGSVITNSASMLQQTLIITASHSTYKLLKTHNTMFTHRMFAQLTSYSSNKVLVEKYVIVIKLSSSISILNADHALFCSSDTLPAIYHDDTVYLVRTSWGRGQTDTRTYGTENLSCKS